MSYSSLPKPIAANLISQDVKVDTAANKPASSAKRLPLKQKKGKGGQGKPASNPSDQATAAVQNVAGVNREDAVLPPATNFLKGPAGDTLISAAVLPVQTGQQVLKNNNSSTNILGQDISGLRPEIILATEFLPLAKEELVSKGQIAGTSLGTSAISAALTTLEEKKKSLADKFANSAKSSQPQQGEKSQVLKLRDDYIEKMTEAGLYADFQVQSRYLNYVLLEESARDCSPQTKSELAARDSEVKNTLNDLDLVRKEIEKVLIASNKARESLNISAQIDESSVQAKDRANLTFALNDTISTKMPYDVFSTKLYVQYLKMLEGALLSGEISNPLDNKPTASTDVLFYTHPYLFWSPRGNIKDVFLNLENSGYAFNTLIKAGSWDKLSGPIIPPAYNISSMNLPIDPVYFNRFSSDLKTVKAQDVQKVLDFVSYQMMIRLKNFTFDQIDSLFGSWKGSAIDYDSEGTSAYALATSLIFSLGAKVNTFENQAIVQGSSLFDTNTIYPGQEVYVDRALGDVSQDRTFSNTALIDDLLQRVKETLNVPSFIEETLVDIEVAVRTAGFDPEILTNPATLIERIVKKYKDVPEEKQYICLTKACNQQDNISLDVFSYLTVKSVLHVDKERIKQSLIGYLKRTDNVDYVSYDSSINGIAYDPSGTNPLQAFIDGLTTSKFIKEIRELMGSVISLSRSPDVAQLTGIGTTDYSVLFGFWSSLIQIVDKVFVEQEIFLASYYPVANESKIASGTGTGYNEFVVTLNSTKKAVTSFTKKSLYRAILDLNVCLSNRLKLIYSSFQEFKDVVITSLNRQGRFVNALIQNYVAPNSDVFRRNQLYLLSNGILQSKEINSQQQLVRVLDNTLILQKTRDALYDLMGSRDPQRDFSRKDAVCLTIGVPSGLSDRLFAQPAVGVGWNVPAYSPSKRKDIVRISVTRTNELNPVPKFIGKREFLFDLSLLPYFSPSSEIPLFIDYQSVDPTPVQIEQIDYSFLSPEERQDLISNHKISYLLESYILLFTGLQINDYSFYGRDALDTIRQQKDQDKLTNPLAKAVKEKIQTIDSTAEEYLNSSATSFLTNYSNPGLVKSLLLNSKKYDRVFHVFFPPFDQNGKSLAYKSDRIALDEYQVTILS